MLLYAKILIEFEYLKREAVSMNIHEIQNKYTTSIIILTYNKLEYTQACIESIRRYTQPGTYRMIVIDNLSTDGTRDWLAEQTDILTVFNEENVGFPKGCNQGIDLAGEDDVLLLNNDILAAENWLDSMKDCLYSADNIGAVGPVSNSAYGDQDIAVSYSNLEEMWSFANTYNRTSPPNWEQKLKLIGFCMLIRKEVIAKVGLLDEMFSPGMCEDSDYSFRIIQSGYKLMLCHNVFIHHFGSTSFGEMPEVRKQLWERNRNLFAEKWGFHTAYDTQAREDLLHLMDKQNRNKAIRVLDIGCACGATLLKIKHLYPNAELYGIERNESSAAIAGAFAHITVGEADLEVYPSHSYDYIILGDVLHYLAEPWEFISRLKKALKPNGKLLASIPNASYYGLIFTLIKGNSLYAENQILESKQLKLFTLEDIAKGFEYAGLSPIKYEAKVENVSESVGKFIENLASLTGASTVDHLKTEKYLIIAESTIPSKTSLAELLIQLEEEREIQNAAREISAFIKSGEVTCLYLIKTIQESASKEKQKKFNILANQFYTEGLFNDVIPLLNASLQIDPKHHDTLYNYAFILHQVEADEQALFYLNMIDEKNEDSDALYQKIVGSINN